MNVLFDVQHPAQVHLFRHAVAEISSRGHETLVTSREKEVTLSLLDAYDIEHVPLTRRGDRLPALAWEALVREIRMLSVARSFAPDVIVSRLNPPSVHTARVLGCRSVVLEDTNVATGPLGRVYYAVTTPFVDLLCAPPGLGIPVPAARTRTIPFQELAYLHPDRFTPDPDALEAHGVAVDEPYAVLRLAAWDAYHDIGHAGLGPEMARRLVTELVDWGPVYVSTEGEPRAFGAHALPVPPHLVHDLLYYADLYVGDSGTMSSEAAMLGTPAVRTNSASGRADPHTFAELERRYGLLHSFADERAALDRALELAADPDAKHDWRRKRERLVAEQGDVTDAIVRTVLDAPSASTPAAGGWSA